MGTTPHEALDPNIPIQSSSTKSKAKNESINFENPIFAKPQINDKDSRVEQKSSESRFLSSIIQNYLISSFIVCKE
jgi:hypothetical protein